MMMKMMLRAVASVSATMSTTISTTMSATMSTTISTTGMHFLPSLSRVTVSTRGWPHIHAAIHQQPHHGRYTHTGPTMLHKQVELLLSKGNKTQDPAQSRSLISRAFFLGRPIIDELDPSICQALCHSMIRTNLWTMATQLCDLIIQRGLGEYWTFVAHIRVLVLRRARRQLTQAYESMTVQHKVAPSIDVLNLLAHSFSFVPDEELIQYVRKEFDVWGVTPDACTYMAFLNWLRTTRKYNEIPAMIEEMEAEACGDRGLPWTAMSFGMRAKVEMFGLRHSSPADIAWKQLHGEASELYDKNLKQVATMSSSVSVGVTDWSVLAPETAEATLAAAAANPYVWRDFVFARNRDDVRRKEVVAMYDEIKEKYSTDVGHGYMAPIALQLLAQSLSYVGAHNQLHELWDYVRRLPMRVKPRIIHGFIDAFGRSGNALRVLEVLEFMQASKQAPLWNTYDVLVQALFNCHEYDIMLSVPVHEESQGKPSLSAYVLELYRLARSSKFEEMLEVLYRMKYRRHRPNQFLFKYMLRTFETNQRHQLLERALKEMRALGISLPEYPLPNEQKRTDVVRTLK